MMESDKENLHSPSFNAYSSSSSFFSCNINSSSHTLAQIADRVVREFHHFYDDEDDLFPHQTHKEQQQQSNKYKQNEDDDDHNNYQKEDEEFEFAILSQPLPLHSSPVPADQIFYNGQIRPLYPLFNTKLLYFDANHNHNDDDDPAPVKAKSAPVIRLPLGKLFMEEAERDTASCSSSEADEYLQGVPANTYCVWRPKAPVEKCKKSNSTGNSSKRWKFRDLIYRSNSDGKDTVVFLATKKEEARHKKASSGIRKEAAIVKGKGVEDEEAVKGSGKRWYLGEKKDTDPGLFANVNRSIHPF